MPHSSRAFLCGPLLKSVSRSFYLTLRVLPTGMRDPVGLAYLLARAADTIADTALIDPARRLSLLLSLRELVQAHAEPQPDRAASNNDDARTRTIHATTHEIAHEIEREIAGRQTQPDEKRLLESLGLALDALTQLDAANRVAVRDIVTTLTEGMEFDLRTFPDERAGRLVALREPAELDRYTYLVAGCVGEFWTQMSWTQMSRTQMSRAHDFDHAQRLGVRFGKALQMTNVLRDCARDLRMGRCYLPSTLLAQHGLTPEDLLQADASRRARPVLCELIALSLAHFRAAINYTLLIPRASVRLRLACAWPVLIGLETLLRLAHNDDWLNPAHASRVARGKVYRILAGSIFQVCSNGLLRAWMERLIGKIERQIGA